jgi:hypothetical protein
MKHTPTNPKPPDPWLCIIREADGLEWVYWILESTNSPDFLAFVGGFESWHLSQERALVIAKGSPLRCRGGSVTSPAALADRDNWFERWASILEPHLRDPRPTHVFTYAPGRLTDLRGTFQSTPEGPFPWPQGAPWPTCGFCGNRLGFVGALDFREIAGPKVPGSTLVYHLCQDCGACQDDEANRLTWLKTTDEVALVGKGADDVRIGTRWQATEYPTLAYSGQELDADGEFGRQTQIYYNFTCFGDKIGGHIFWIQSEDVPNDAEGQPMVFIGQSVGSPDISIGDGLVYFFFSERTQETKMVMQYS